MIKQQKIKQAFDKCYFSSTAQIQNVELIAHKTQSGPVRYGLDVTYHITDKFGNIDEVVIKNVQLPFNTRPALGSDLADAYRPHTIDFGFGTLYIDSNTSFETNRIKDAVKEKTLEELEKELGYKIKLVDRKE